MGSQLMIVGGAEAPMASTRPDSRSMAPAAVGLAPFCRPAGRLRNRNDAFGWFYGVTHD